MAAAPMNRREEQTSTRYEEPYREKDGDENSNPCPGKNLSWRLARGEDDC
jgi:hypothetical protein